MALNATIRFAVAKESDIAKQQSIVAEDGLITFSENNIYLGLGDGEFKRYDGLDTESAVKFYPDIRDEGEAIAKGVGILYYDNASKAMKITVKKNDAITTTTMLEGIVVDKDLEKLKGDFQATFISANQISKHYYNKSETYNKEEIINLTGNFEALDEKIKAEVERATQAETDLKTELEGKTKAITYKANVNLHVNDFVVYAQSIYLVSAAFTTTGNFEEDQNKLFKLNSSGSGGTKVVDYVQGVTIDEGNMVIYNGAIYLCKNKIETASTWETDKTNMVDFGASIDLSSYYKKAEIQALMAQKQDKLTPGAGVKVQATDNAINISADMTTDATENKIAQRDTTGRLFGKNSTSPTGDELVNASSMRTQLDMINQSFKDLREEVVGSTKEFFIINQTIIVSEPAQSFKLDFQTNIDVSKIAIANQNQDILNINLATQKAVFLANPADHINKFPIEVTLTKGGNTLATLWFNKDGATEYKKSTSSYQSNMYKVYTVCIDMSAAGVDPTTCCWLEDDAKGKTKQEIMDFIGLKPIIMDNGSIFQYLDPNDYTKQSNGNSAMNAQGLDYMMYFPKRGVRWQKDGTIYRISITDQENNKEFSYKHCQRGKLLKDRFYYGIYQGYVVNSKLYSQKDVLPTVYTTLTAFRNYAKARGEGYQLPSSYMVNYIQACYLLVHQSLNSQKTVGTGCSYTSNYVDRNMGIKTGGSDTWGMNSEKCPTASWLTDQKHNIKCLGIEDLWGNAWDWIDGIYIDGNTRICLSTDPDNYNDNGAGYQVVGAMGDTIYGGNGEIGYVSDIACNNDLMFFPKSVQNGSDSKYFCDYFWQSSNKCAMFGGCWLHGSMDGVFCWYLLNAASDSAPDIGARLAYL